jgi:Domain of unknown function (DUF1127)
MAMLSNIRPFPPAETRDRSRLGSHLFSRGKWLIDRFVAAAIARHQRQVEFFVLRNLTDRELKDIGIYRNQIGPGLEDAARTRTHLQGFDPR